MRSSSKILEHTPLVETITLNVQESLTSLEPRTSDDGPDVTDDFKDLNQLLADLEAEDNDEKLEVEVTFPLWPSSGFYKVGATSQTRLTP